MTEYGPHLIENFLRLGPLKDHNFLRRSPDEQKTTVKMGRDA